LILVFMQRPPGVYGLDPLAAQFLNYDRS
jgi:hypothetical protein